MCVTFEIMSAALPASMTKWRQGSRHSPRAIQGGKVFLFRNPMIQIMDQDQGLTARDWGLARVSTLAMTLMAMI